MKTIDGLSFTVTRRVVYLLNTP